MFRFLFFVFDNGDGQDRYRNFLNAMGEVHAGFQSHFVEDCMTDFALLTFLFRQIACLNIVFYFFVSTSIWFSVFLRSFHCKKKVSLWSTELLSVCFTVWMQSVWALPCCSSFSLSDLCLTFSLPFSPSLCFPETHLSILPPCHSLFDGFYAWFTSNTGTRLILM